MTSPRFRLALIAAAAALSWVGFLVAQTTINTTTESEVPTNTAIIPLPSTDGGLQRTDLVLQRAKQAPGNYGIEFVGDSITQAWESDGKNVWAEYYSKRNAINFGVGGDRTQNVLWRFEQGQLDGIKAKVAVVMIGTNNSSNRENTEAEILAGVTAVVQQVRTRQPETKIILFGIFPRGETFNPQRGSILQVNQALARLDDGRNIFFIDIGPQLIDDDASIAKTIMPDYLHLSEIGYMVWARAMEAKLKQLLGD
jgi:lysophospholipase L1-like esterase